MQFPDFFPDGEALETTVSFHFEDVAIDLPDESSLIAWLLSVAVAEDKHFQEVTYIFCSDEYLRGINVEYLDHDYYTDIITFQLSDHQIHGDLFISTERVSDNAQAHGVSFQYELCRVMVHGVLHLAGYGDKTPEEATQMRAKEDFYLGQLVL